LQFLALALLASIGALFLARLGASHPTGAGGAYIFFDGCSYPPGFACVEEEEAEESQMERMREVAREFDAAMKVKAAPGAQAVSASPGQAAARELGYNGTPSGATLDYLYTPPAGATGFAWSDLGGGTLTQNPDGSFRLDDVPAAVRPTVAYTLPANLPVESQAVDVLQVEDGEARAAAALYTPIVATGGDAAQAPPGVPAPSEGPSAQAVGQAWHVQHSIYARPDITITQAGCQDWVNFLQSNAAFLGFRAPLSPTVGADSYAWPVVFTEPESATVSVTHTPMKAPIEYRPERAAFLENALPSAPGEHWVPLGLAMSPTVTCPAGNLTMGLGAGKSEIFADLYLELDATERVLPVYFCYEGQEGPPGVPAAALAAARLAGIGATGFQGEDITCLGPYQQELRNAWPNLYLYGTYFRTITPTHTISLGISVGVWVPQPATATLAYGSDLAVGWGLYRDAAGTQPITPGVTPLVLDADPWYEEFWALAEVPGAGAPAPGPYSFVVTATHQGDGSQVAHTVLLWLGGWVPPPGGMRPVYVPALLRQ